MTAGLLIDFAVPVLDRFFAPMSLQERISYSPYLVWATLDFCLGCTCLALWRTARYYRAFLSIGLYLLAVCVIQLGIYMGGWGSVWVVNTFASPLFIVAAGEAMHVPYRRWMWLLCPLGVCVAVIGWFPSAAFVHSWPVDASQIVLVVLIAQGLRRRDIRDRRIAAVFIAFFFVRWLASRSFLAFLHMPDDIIIAGWRWSFISIAVTLLGAATLVVFFRDLIADRREKERLAIELEQARAIQQILIPEGVAAVPGFHIQSVYEPHGEVGGDFFQILPLAGGGALIAIGDVSGKGLPAAMQVSLLVGTLRALADSMQSPATILTAANRHMIGRSNGGFTTCLVLRVDPGGAITAANAGHLPPYCNGIEVTLDNGLPLGLDAKASYEESTFMLAEETQLTLLTDGVLEARDATGELFGFARTAAISAKPAGEVAHAAKAFGQEDDITVVTLSCVAPARVAV